MVSGSGSIEDQQVEAAAKVIKAIADALAAANQRGIGEPESVCKLSKQYLQQLEKTLDQGLFDTLANTIKVIDDVEGFIDASAIQQRNVVKGVLEFLNTETNKVIGQPIWPVGDVEFVSKSLTDALPIAVKTVNKALVRPVFNIPKNALAKELLSKNDDPTSNTGDNQRRACDGTVLNPCL